MYGIIKSSNLELLHIMMVVFEGWIGPTLLEMMWNKENPHEGKVIYPDGSVYEGGGASWSTQK